MEQSTIAIIILLSALVLYCCPKFPLSVTTILAMLAMAMTGIISYADAYSGFANSAIFLISGMMIIGHSWFTSGLAYKFGSLLYRFVGTNEKLFVAMILLIAASMSVFLNGSLTVAILMPIIDSIVVRSKGAITRKQTYFPLGIASVLGNNLTTISATSMITAGALLAEGGFRELGLFEPTAVNLPALVVVIVLYMLFGYKLQQKWFTFDEVMPDADIVEQGVQVEFSSFKIWTTGIVTVAVVIALIMGVNSGAAALLGAAILILTGCIDEKAAFRSISWSTIVIVAGAMGFSKGIDASGAGSVIANFIISLFGTVGQSPFGMCVVLFLIGSLLSNIMSDNASVAILIPITLVLAEALQVDATPLVLSAASGVKVALATPISVAPMTVIGVAGYRFKDYFYMGGLVNIVSMFVTCISIWFFYFA